MEVNQKYTNANILKAIEEVNAGHSVSTAARNHGIPWSTLDNRVKGKASDKKGRPTCLSDEEVKLLFD